MPELPELPSWLAGEYHPKYAELAANWMIPPVEVKPFMRRADVPIEQCACPYLMFECYEPATGEDRLCDNCRGHHNPDFPREDE